MSFDTTALDSVIKEVYSDEDIAKPAYEVSPFIGLATKKNDFVGSPKIVPVTYGSNQSVSNLDTTAFALTASASLKGFSITHSKMYGRAVFDGMTLEIAKKDKGAFIDALTFGVDNTLNALSLEMASQVWGYGLGVIGKISSTSNVTLATITLDDINDIVNFEVGMVLQTSATAGTGGAIRTGTVTVTAINRESGTITTSAHWDDSITGCTAGDYIFRSGNYGLGVASVRKWLPTTAPTSGDSFFGIDRSADPDRLAGIRHAASGTTVEESVIDAVIKGGKYGARFSHLFLNPTQMAELHKAMASKFARNVDEAAKGIGNVMYSALEIPTPKGAVKVHSDPFVPAGYGYLLNMKDWALESAGGVPRLLDRDGKVLRVSGADSYEVRFGGYWQLVCANPGSQMVITF
jgi:hypothetical protein